MKYLKQLAIIGIISFIGEMLNKIIDLSVPASVYGLLILLVSLFAGWIKVEQVEDVAQYFILIMPIMFISPTVSIMTMLGGVKNSILGILITAFVSTIVVMVVTGWVTQLIIRFSKAKFGGGKDE